MSVIKKIKIQFNELETILEGDSLVIPMNNGVSDFTLSEGYRQLRARNGQVTIGASNLPEENALNLANAINLDGFLVGLNAYYYQDGLDYYVELYFLNDSYYFLTPTGNLITDSKVFITTTNGDIAIPNSLTVLSYEQNLTNVCEDVTIQLKALGGTGVYSVYLGVDLLLSNQSSLITVSSKRGNRDLVRVVDSTGLVIGSIFTSNPRRLISSDIETSISFTTTGSNLNITVPFISSWVSSYEYSLDNITFKEENIFTGLLAGDYTVYVKDSFGCVTNKTITVNSYTSITETVFSISEINTIRYAKYDLDKKNYFNTLSCNELRLVKYPFTHTFLEEDAPITQFKTNASYINVYAYDSDLNKTPLVPIKRTENIGLSAKSTCKYFDLGDGKSGVYFGVVDLLDPITDAVIGDANYGFTLPEWANTVGNFVSIENLGTVLIDNIVYSDVYESYILELNISYTGLEVVRTISAVYNLQPYEVYEFTTSMNLFTTNFNIVIEVGSSDTAIDYTYVSEKISIVEDNDYLFEIEYYESDQRNFGDMVYQTGIKNKIRLNGYCDYLGEQSTEGYDGDKEFYVTDNTVYNSEQFSFLRVPTAIAHKLRLIFAHSFLSINGVQYKLADSPEIATSGNSNFKNFIVTLKSGGNLLLTDDQEQITNTETSLEIGAGLTAVKGSGMILWTKTL